MEIMELSLYAKVFFKILIDWKIISATNFAAVIPTVLVPLTALTVLLSSIASIIAGWFGLKLKTDGPKQLLEVLLTKRVMIAAIGFNLVCYGAYYSYQYIKNYPRFLSTIDKKHIPIEKHFTYDFPADRVHHFSLEQNISQKPLQLKYLREETLKGGTFRSIVIGKDSLFRATTQGYVEEIDRHTLKPIRDFYIGTFIATRPVIAKDHLYSGEGSHDTHSARIYSYDLKTGKLKATYQTKGHTEGTPVFVDYQGHNILIAVAGKDGVHAMTAPDLKPLWKINDGHIDASVAIKDGSVYAGTGNEKNKQTAEKRYASKYDLITGKTIWKKELPLSNWMQPVVTDSGLACYVLGEIYFQSDLGSLYCLDTISGNPMLAIPTNAPLVGKPTYVRIGTEEYIYGADITGSLYGFSLNQRKIIFQFSPKSLSDYALSSPTFDPTTHTLLYQGPNGDLYVLDAFNGKLISEYNFKTSSYASPSIDGNNIYTIDMKGLLRHFTLESAQ